MSENKTKKIVHYDRKSAIMINVGYAAIIETLDHPNCKNLKGEPVFTSKVIAHNEYTGEFETLNTLYKPIDLQ